jgi:HTH-type transcriptional regulator / antitoxin HigA
LTSFTPKVVRSEKQNAAYIEALFQMEQHHSEGTPEEAELADLLTLIIEDYEAKHYTLPRSSPREVVEFLMDQHAMPQEELAQVIGSSGAAAEIVSGSRDLTRQEISLLSERFHVSPELFF